MQNASVLIVFEKKKTKVSTFNCWSKNIWLFKYWFIGQNVLHMTCSSNLTFFHMGWSFVKKQPFKVNRSERKRDSLKK